MTIAKYLDEYDFRARFVPSIIVTLPIISAIIALFPPARQLYGLLIGPVLEVVLVLVLVRVARDEGKKMAIMHLTIHELNLIYIRKMPSPRFTASFRVCARSLAWLPLLASLALDAPEALAA
jgi:hypothetical protein